MKLFVVAVLVAAASAAKLQNNYLPPGSAHSAGGSGNFLAAPFGASGAFGGASGPKFGGSSTPNFGTTAFGGSSGHKSDGASHVSAQQYGAPAGGAHGFSGPKSAEAGAGIVRYNNVNNGDGSYQFEYETQNKISHNEAGQLKSNDAEEVHGSYSYISPEGQTITVNYIANEFGFQPTGDHLPTSPPIPEAILKSLQQIAAAGPSANAYSGANNGQYQSNNLNNQYLAPNTHGSNSQSGYKY